MAGTVTAMGSRIESHFRVDRYKLAHTTGGLSFTAEPGAAIKRIVQDDSSTAVTQPPNDAYAREVATDALYSTYDIVNQDDNTTLFLELWYGANLNPAAAF